jgi:phenylalanyl-tRNA synthetase beta chain
VRVPVDWLYEYCEPELSVAELASLLAMTGTEVERIEHHGVPALDGFVVGHVLERRKHPDADRLNVCLVDLGDSEPHQIVCGAPNVEAGLTVGVAQPGSVMPDGTKLKRAKLRGQESNGMILSERELSISQEHDGIMVLSPAWEPGTPLGEVIPISTDVLVLEITPNRPDCLGIYGIAREVHAATGAALAPAPWAEDLGRIGELSGISIINDAGPELNRRFTARVFENVRVGQSPIWLKARLMAAGMRPISNVVDITNYVMLATGQPMHAFDLDKVAGGRLTVRRAGPGEPVETLDGQTRTLDPSIVVIEDADGPTSIAGVMGGARSEVSASTTTVLSEVATWSGPNIHNTALKLALNSEAASRNAKGLAPEQTLWAQALATKLFIEVAGASVRPGTLDLGGAGPEPVRLVLRTRRVASLLGTEVSPGRSAELLGALGFGVSHTAEGLEVEVPSFRRADVTREVDLIEEVARLEVLAELPATLPARRASFGQLSERQKQRRRAADLLTGQGMDEVVGWSFASPEQNRRLGLEVEPVRLLNPMSTEQSLLRSTLLGSVLDIAARNRAQGASRIAIFEMGPTYAPGEVTGAAEAVHLLGVLIGPVRRPNWRDPNPPGADFFAAKGAAQALLAGLGVDAELEAGDVLASLHPSRAAALSVGGERVGFVGEVHPRVAAEWDLEETVASFAINLDKLPLGEVRQYRDLTSFPTISEDLAVVVSDDVSAANLIRVIEAAAKPLLQRAEVFDVYRDSERLGKGKVSLAVRLAFGAADRTLTDGEVAAKRTKIVAAIEQQLGGAIRV